MAKNKKTSKHKDLVQGVKRWYSVIIAGIIILLYIVQQAYTFIPTPRETDVAGYLTLAERMARGLPLSVKDDDIFRYQSHVWVETDDGMIIAKYPPGYPAAMAAGYLLGGNTGMYLISPIAGVLSLIGAFMLFRYWMSDPFALLALLMLAINDMFLFYTNFPLSHSLNLCMVTWGMYFLWTWKREPGWGSSIGAGLCLGFAQIVRPVSVLFILVILTVVTVIIIQNKSERVKNLMFASLLLCCYSVFIVLHVLYNYTIYGSFFITGYALAGEQWAYDWRYLVGIHPGRNLVGLAGKCVPGLFSLGLLGMILRPGKLEKAMCFLWWVPVFLLYTAYYWATRTYGAAYLRFFICFFPLFIGFAYSFFEMIPWPPRKRFVLAGTFTLILLATVGYAAVRDQYMSLSDYVQTNHRSAAEKTAEVLDSETVIFTQPPLAYYIGHGKDFRIYNLRVFDNNYVRWRIENPRPNSVRRQNKRTERLKEFYKENKKDLKNKKIELVNSLLSKNRTVVFLIPQSLRRREENSLGKTLAFEIIEEWPTQEIKWVVDSKSLYNKEARDSTWGLYKVERRGH